MGVYSQSHLEDYTPEPCGLIDSDVFGLHILSVPIYIIDTKQSPCEGGCLAESDEKGGVNLALRVDEDTTEEKNETSEGENKCGYKLQIGVHIFFKIFCKYILKKGRFANLTPLVETKMYF